MKRALWPLGCCCLLFGSTGLARAGNPPAASSAAPPTTISAPAATSDLSTVAPAPSAGAPNFSLPSVSSTIDFSTTDPEQIAEQTMAISQQSRNRPDDGAIEEEQKAQEEQHNWMLRGYHSQLRKNGLESAPVADPYAAPGSGENGAKTTDPLGEQMTADQGVADDADQPARHHDDAPAPTNLSTPTLTAAAPLQPMLPPLTDPSTPASTTATPDYFNLPAQAMGQESIAQATSPAIPTDAEDSMLDTPGMTAAQQGLPPDQMSLEDRLPDEPPDQMKSTHDENVFTAPTAPLSDVDAFYKKQASSLQPPNAPTFQALVSGPVAPNHYEPPPPRPLAKPVVTGLRTQIADPFDILNRPRPAD